MGEVVFLIKKIHADRNSFEDLVKRKDPLINKYIRLLYKDEKEDVLEQARHRNKYVNIITNGLQIDGFIDVIERYKKSVNVQITLDGIEKIHNQQRPDMNGELTYSRVTNNIMSCLKKNIKIVVRTNVSASVPHFSLGTGAYLMSLISQLTNFYFPVEI